MDQKTLKTLITYDPTLGVITRITPTTNRQRSGDTITTPTMSLYGKSYSTFSIIWLYVMGVLPTSRVFTLDGNKSNLCVSNLTTAYTLPKEVTQDVLKFFLHYSPLTGTFTWVHKVSISTMVGSVAGSVTGGLPDGGYVDIMLFGKPYKAHRLAWLYTHGAFPDKQIDHIDHNRANNCISNLRQATQHTNMKNKSMYITNTTGYSGVELHGEIGRAHV